MKRLSIALLTLALLIVPILVAYGSTALSTTLLITKLQTAGSSSSTEEFIEIFNTSAEELDVTGWRIEYLTAAGNLSSPYLATLEGTLAPGNTILLAREGNLPEAPLHFTNGLSDTGGHIRIVDEESTVVDLLGWGTAVQPEATAAPAPPAGRQLERQKTEAGTFVETDNNATDFALSAANVPNIPPPPAAPSAPTAGLCEGITISELLPNPTGTDSSHEFIELYNPTAEPVSLAGCKLSVDNKTFTFAEDTLAAGGYLAFPDSKSGLTLPNAAGGEVVLITTGNELAVRYPADLGDSEAWAFVNGVWQITNNPTPSAANMASTLSASTAAAGDEDLTPCPAGKYRNPATNRCKTIESDDDELTPCKAGQERNPDTNRCRSVQAASATFTPCKPGQERNPETNRCRSVEGANTSLAPCDEGEERNPETNRCRKVAPTTAAKAAEPPKAGSSKVSYLAMGAVAAAATGYGAYEYRNDIRNKLAQAKTRFFPGQSSK